MSKRILASHNYGLGGVVYALYLIVNENGTVEDVEVHTPDQDDFLVRRSYVPLLLCLLFKWLLVYNPFRFLFFQYKEVELARLKRQARWMTIYDKCGGHPSRTMPKTLARWRKEIKARDKQ